MDLQILEDVGLSTAEAKIYVALLELGSSTTGDIIKKSGLQSSTVYHLLDSLLEKGVVAYVKRGKIKHYQSQAPEVFLDKLEEKKDKLRQILPDLKEKENLGKSDTDAEVFEGIKGVRAAFNNILHELKEGEEYYFFQFDNGMLSNENLMRFLRSYHLKRAEAGINVKGLALKDTKDAVDEIFKDLKNSEIKYVNSFVPTGLLVYNDKVLHTDWSDVPTVFVMKSKKIANSYRKFFEEKWGR